MIEKIVSLHHNKLNSEGEGGGGGGGWQYNINQANVLVYR